MSESSESAVFRSIQESNATNVPAFYPQCVILEPIDSNGHSYAMAQFDAIVIGAGAAGLAAAIKLAECGRSVCILEAKSRIGGRVLTTKSAGLAVPIEQGAEFVHGRSPTTSAWLQRANIALVDASQERWRMQAGRLQTGDTLFEQMKRALDRIRPPKKDLPFADFLERSRDKLSPAIRQFARSLAEGFDAADATRVSTLQILDEWSGSASADAPTFRPLGGYGALIECMGTALNSNGVELLLDTVVHEVEWRRGMVSVKAKKNGESFEVTGSQAVIAVPLGVLQESAIRFTPALTAKTNALAQLATGPVIKVAMHFRTAFWEETDKGRYKDGAFFFSTDASFPTWWTQLPIRAPLLVAWAGGPNANRLSNKSEDEILKSAMDSLRSIFPKHKLGRRDLQSAHVHNWQTDPFARGAYSYVVAGGSTERKRLSKPLDDTLFFAGEATATDEPATVAGALESGERAARQIVTTKAAGN